MNCYNICETCNIICAQKKCRYWNDYKEDLNCTIVTANKHGPLTLEETAKRLNISLVRVKQIQDGILKKLKKNNNIMGF